MSDFFHKLSQNSVTPEEKTAEFLDAVDVFMGYKQKTADFEDEHGTGGPISTEERADIPKKDFAQPEKENPSTETKGKYPIPDRQHAKSALGFAKMHGDAKAYAAVRKKVEQKYPDMLEKDASMLSRMARSAAGWGTAGGVMGAASAKEGERLKGFGKGLALGTLGGVVAAPAESGMSRILSRFSKTSEARLAEVAKGPAELPPDLRARIKAGARYRYPSKEPVSEEVKGLWSFLKNKYRDFAARRTATSVAPPIPLLKDASIGSTVGKMIPSYLKTPTGAGVTAATAAAFGIGNYIANMPRESLGGKGKAQVHYEDKVRANQAAGEEGASLNKKIRNRLAEFQKGLATEFTSHPGGAAATGAVVGAGIGSQVARLLQGIR